MQKVCTLCKTAFEITKDELDFYKKVSPISFTPTLCPDCRMQRRIIFRNEHNLYNDECDLCHKHIISSYSPDKNCTVYCNDCWWSDNFDPLKYGQEINFSQPFIQEFKKLFEKVPKRALQVVRCENCEYTNYSRVNKNCYMCTSVTHCEDLLYCAAVDYMTNSAECLYCDHCTLGYELIDCRNCYNTSFSIQCELCNDSSFLFNCKSCNNCLFCFNLRNKEYYYFNKPISKKEFEQKKREIFTDRAGLEKAKKVFLEESKKFPRLYCEIINCEDCSGDHLENCRHCEECFDIYNSEFCKYHWRNYGAKYVYDAWACADSELIFDGLMNSESYHILFSSHCTNSANILYSDNCHQAKDCFGCVGIKHKQFCILNKQYSEKEYKELTAKIIQKMVKPQLGGAEKEYGEFFPALLSPYAYNETVAYDYFPLTKDEILKKGFKWKEPDSKEHIPPSKDILACELCGKNYRIIKEEEKFYEKLKIPTPTKCPECRYSTRMSLRNPRKLWDRKCDKCGIEIRSSYSHDRSEIVYCEKCYLKALY